MDRRLAFTLVELMIAIALSVLVIVLAASAFRMVLQAIGHLERLGLENEHLRSGYLLAMEDVDYWHSHANPSFPYMKGFMSDADRPFAPADMEVVAPWDPTLELNLNQLHPNDARGWYRGTLTASPRPFQIDKLPQNDGSERPRFREFWTSSNSPLIADKDSVPNGWSGRTVHGDYAAMASTDPSAGLAPPTDPDELEVRGTRGAVMDGLYQRLGHIGLSSYMPPGEIQIFQHHNGNQAVANIASPTKGIRHWGEIPGSLDLGSMTDPGDHYYYGMPTSQGDPSLDNWFKLANPDQRMLDKTPSNMPYMMDFDIASTRQGQRGKYRWGLLFSPKMRPTDFLGASYDTRWIDQSTGQPWTLLTLDGGREGRTSSSGDWISSFQFRRAATNNWILPFAVTDEPAPSRGDLPEEIPSLSTRLVRYRYMSNDRVLVSVRIQDPATGRSLELNLRAIGTSYRGARQHWGWKTRYDSSGLKAAGDYYE